MYLWPEGMSSCRTTKELVAAISAGEKGIHATKIIDMGSTRVLLTMILKDRYHVKEDTVHQH